MLEPDLYLRHQDATGIDDRMTQVRDGELNVRLALRIEPDADLIEPRGEFDGNVYLVRVGDLDPRHPLHGRDEGLPILLR